MSKRIIKELSGMDIDEVSLVDRGANQHALISFAKRHDGVDSIFEKARGGGHTSTSKATSNVKAVETATGSDPQGVVDEFVSNDGKGDTGAPGARVISGTEKTKGSVVNGRSGPAKGKKATQPSAPDDEESDVDTYSKALEYTDEEVELAKRLGLFLDEDYDDYVEKNFGPPQQSPFQQQGQAPQFGAQPIMQSTGAQPMGMGQPVAPGGMPGMAPAGPNPMAPGMPSGGPQVPGPTAAPPQLNVAQLPPEVIQYIQQLEKQVAQSQGGGQTDSPESSDSSSKPSESDNSDSSNKPFGKSGDFDMDHSFLEELSKAIADEDGRAEFSKALQARFDAYETEISKAQTLAQEERDLRLEREFIAKAADFSVPVASDELGPVLKRAYESLDEADFAVIVKCLDAATELAGGVFTEVGKRGTGANVDIFDAVEAEASELAKNYEVTPEQGIAAVFEANPSAYDQYRANQPGHRF